MTAIDRAEQAIEEYGFPYHNYSGLVALVEQAITAAVEEDRRTRPHSFVGRTDRYCELCNEPDRDEIHIASREMMRNWVILAVEEEREACAKIADEMQEEHWWGDEMGDIGEAIRERCTSIASACNKSATESITK